MKHSVFTIFLALLLTAAILVPSAWADTSAQSGQTQTASIPKNDTGKSALSDLNKDLARKQKTLVKKALTWMATANTHLIPSRRKPRIEKLPDGSYKAVYHMRRQYLDEEVSARTGSLFEVTKEKHGYSGTFRFVEVVYESRGATPEACRTGEFVPKVRRPNAQIFCFTNGAWQ